MELVGFVKKDHVNSRGNNCLEIGEEMKRREWECVGNKQIAGQLGKKKDVASCTKCESSRVCQ